MPNSSVKIKRDTASRRIVVCAQKSGIPIETMTDERGNIDYHTTIIDLDHMEMSIDVKLHCAGENIIALTQAGVLSFIKEGCRSVNVEFAITPGNLEVCDRRIFVKGLYVKSPYYLRAVLSAPKKYISKNMPKHCKGARTPFAKRHHSDQTNYVGGNPFPFQGGTLSPK